MNKLKVIKETKDMINDTNKSWKWSKKLYLMHEGLKWLRKTHYCLCHPNETKFSSTGNSI